MKSSLIISALAAIGCASLAIAACSAGANRTSRTFGDGGSEDTGGTNQGGASSATGNLFNTTGSANDGGLDPDSACAASSVEATLAKKPVDIIFIIDNSGSMSDDIVAVQNNINDNFASIIGASGVDYRVIMISQHGQAASYCQICVAAPLSTTNCSPVPEQPAQNPPLFYHYSVEIDSYNSLCQLTSTYNQPDVLGLAPNGWREWLRPEAVKVFVEITDDAAYCGAYYDQNTVSGGTSAAAQFDKDLLALDPAHFGDEKNRNYIWHSIIGLAENNPPTAAYLPGDPMVPNQCSGAPGPGTGYQALSILTGGLRFPICQNQSFDIVFQEIAKGVIAGAKVACDLPLPKPPDGEAIDHSTVVVKYTPAGTGAPENFKKVASATECGPASFHIEGELIKICPDACSVVQADDKAKIAILYGCALDNPQ